MILLYYYALSEFYSIRFLNDMLVLLVGVVWYNGYCIVEYEVLSPDTFNPGRLCLNGLISKNIFLFIFLNKKSLNIRNY